MFWFVKSHAKSHAKLVIISNHVNRQLSLTFATEETFFFSITLKLIFGHSPEIRYDVILEKCESSKGLLPPL